MQTQLYIPKKIKVGYQKRADTFTNKLAYIIYYDDKNVLRKEKSWNSWRDKEIEPDDFDNKPQSGIIINKNVSRYNWSHFSSNRTYIRMHDPRGFEFEISPENLIGILMNGDCSKRVLDGEFVYSWSGTDLVLLPCNSEEYQTSLEFTKLQANKIGAKDLIPGFAYRTKREENVVYMGRFNWYKFESVKGGDNGRFIGKTCTTQYKQTDKKYHIFKIEGSMVPKTSLDFLSHKLGDEPVSDYAKLMDELNKNIHISPMVGIECVETVYVPKFNEVSNSYKYLKNGYFNVQNDDGSYSTINVQPKQEYVGNAWITHQDKFTINNGYDNDRRVDFDLKTNTFTDKYTTGGYNNNPPVMTLDEINKKFKIRKIFAKMQNGKKVELETSQACNIFNMH